MHLCYPSSYCYCYCYCCPSCSCCLLALARAQNPCPRRSWACTTHNISPTTNSANKFCRWQNLDEAATSHSQVESTPTHNVQGSISCSGYMCLFDTNMTKPPTPGRSLAAGTVEKQVAAIQSDEQLLRRLMGYLAMHPMYSLLFRTPSKIEQHPSTIECGWYSYIYNGGV